VTDSKACIALLGLGNALVTTRIAISHAEYKRMCVRTPVRVDYLPGRAASARRL
jgi:hypothetical protein